MRILVIKQTSLGDVLHSTGHVRTIKQTWPDSELVLLTATGSADIYRHSPWVDKMILVDRYRVKHNWYREPYWCFRHMRDVLRQVRAQSFDLAFDLQGLAKTVLFLYGARAREKFVKGRWPGLKGFRYPHLHAIKEMDGVLALAGIENPDTTMEFATSSRERQKVDLLLQTLNPENKQLVVFSPFSRWPSKDWPLRNYVELASAMTDDYLVLFTGAPDRAGEIEKVLGLSPKSNILNLSGKLNLLEFAELVRRTALMLTGDSFPMHVAVACNTRVIALFGPTDEKRVGPPPKLSCVMRAPDCEKCDRQVCPKNCMAAIPVESVKLQIDSALGQFAGLI
ncbi:MAG: glycosyltransferase family 9 protein [bacterium]